MMQCALWPSRGLVPAQEPQRWSQDSYSKENRSALTKEEKWYLADKNNMHLLVGPGSPRPQEEES